MPEARKTSVVESPASPMMVPAKVQVTCAPGTRRNGTLDRGSSAVLTGEVQWHLWITAIDGIGQ